MNNLSGSLLAVAAVFALIILMIVGMCTVIYLSKQLKKFLKYFIFIR
jgi:uncharacterized membrane protein YuzA (DUF378 family)